MPVCYALPIFALRQPYGSRITKNENWRFLPHLRNFCGSLAIQAYSYRSAEVVSKSSSYISLICYFLDCLPAIRLISSIKPLFKKLRMTDFLRSWFDFRWALHGHHGPLVLLSSSEQNCSDYLSWFILYIGLSNLACVSLVSIPF